MVGLSEERLYLMGEEAEICSINNGFPKKTSVLVPVNVSVSSDTWLTPNPLPFYLEKVGMD